MTGPGVPRPDLEEAVARRARAGPPLLLAGPPGSGKTTLLLGLRDDLQAAGLLPVYLDLMGAASAPDRFVLSALDVLPAEPLAARLPEATRIRGLVAEGRARSGDAVRALFALYAALDEGGGRPVVLLLDEATEVRSLAYFPGLRDVAQSFGRALGARRRGTVLATSFPTLARSLWPGLELLEARPFTEADLAGAVGDPSQASRLVRLTLGWPRYVRVLLDQPGDLLAAWTREMSPGGRLEAAGRHTYEALLLRSRGYGISKAVLQAVAREEGLNLTALVARLGRTPGATRDYLQWLVAVDALRMVKKRYVYVDGLLAVYVRLHARGSPPSADEIERAGAALLEREAPGGPVPAAVPEGPPPRRDSLMEID